MVRGCFEVMTLLITRDWGGDGHFSIKREDCVVRGSFEVMTLLIMGLGRGWSFQYQKRGLCCEGQF